MKRTFLVFSCVASISVGCGVAAHIQAKQAEFERTIPVCYTERDCELKWAAARRWILENSAFKIQHMTNDFIETYNPPRYAAGIAARVVKEPLTGGGYRLVVRTWCDICVPDPWDAALKFNAFVSSVGDHSAPSASPSPSTPSASPSGSTDFELRLPDRPARERDRDKGPACPWGMYRRTDVGCVKIGE